MIDMAYLYRPWFKNREAWPLDARGTWHEDNIYSYVEGASELHATAQSYARFLIRVMTDESLPADLRRQRTTIADNRSHACRAEPGMTDVCPPKMGFGLGWNVYRFDDETLIHHSGSNGHGEKSLVLYSPTRKRGLVVLTNGAHGKHVIYKIAERLGWHSNFIRMLAPTEPVSKEAIALARAAIGRGAYVNLQALDLNVPLLIDEHRIAGLGIGVLQDGRLVWTGSWPRPSPQKRLSRWPRRGKSI